MLGGGTSDGTSRGANYETSENGKGAAPKKTVYEVRDARAIGPSTVANHGFCAEVVFGDDFRASQQANVDRVARQEDSGQDHNSGGDNRKASKGPLAGSPD